MNINSLPARTWEWLKVNETAHAEPGNLTGLELVEKLPDGVLTGISDMSAVSADALGRCVSYADIRSGLGKEFDEAMINTGLKVRTYSVSDVSGTASIYQDIDLSAKDDSATGCMLFFDVKEGTDCIVYQFITSKDDSDDLFLVQNKYNVGPGARLTLVQIENTGKGIEVISDCGGICADGGEFMKIQLVLGGSHTFLGDFCSLEGQKSSYRSDLAYRLTGDHKLDINLVADHTGRESTSEINVSGVMSDTSEKVFRGTIDFHKGCAGSKGAELEDVLLLDDSIVNKTVPLILCDEEDVEGSHGASIGKLDENLLFYMKSRGLEEDRIYEMMAQARVERVAMLIEDNVVLNRVNEMINGPVERECLNGRD